MSRHAMLSRLAFLAAAVAFPCAAFAQSAQEIADEVQAMAGTWEISNADRDRLCTVTFATGTVAGGMKVEFAPACAEAFPVTKEVGAWKLDKEGLHLVDAKGTALIDLDEVEKGIFEGMRPGDGRYFVQSLTAVRSEAKAEQLFGDWQVSRGTDESICLLTLTGKPAAENFLVEVKPNCGTLVTGFAPVSWRMDKGELVIASAKGTWRFEEAGEIAWRRVPEGTDPLWLVRQMDKPVGEGGGG